MALTWRPLTDAAGAVAGGHVVTEIEDVTWKPHGGPAVTEQAAAGGATITFAAGALSIAAQAISVSAARNIFPGAGAISIAAQPITVTRTRAIAFAAGALSIAAGALSLDRTRTVALAAGALSIAADAISIGSTRLIAFGAGAISIAAQAISGLTDLLFFWKQSIRNPARPVALPPTRRPNMPVEPE